MASRAVLSKMLPFARTFGITCSAQWPGRALAFNNARSLNTRRDLLNRRSRIIRPRIRRPTHPSAAQLITEDDQSYYDQGITRVIEDPNGVLQRSDAAAYLLENPALVVERQIEYMNVFLGFEVANKYAILDVNGNHLGYMEEEDFGITKAILRQVYRLHRPFTVKVFDRHGSHLLTIRRPFSWVNSRLSVLTPPAGDNEERVIGESHQSWHLWRRRYNLFLSEQNDSFDQFAAIDAPFLSFRFELVDEENRLLGTVDRNWVGLGRELFTDTGVYILQMDAATADETTSGVSGKAPGMTLGQRAIMLGTAVSIDYDYFSRHSSAGGGGLIGFGGGE
ncbi:Scramblase-domain-containing protein [Lipomyces japonicus]|uniref:Scramblase-domain-containing protein n=1 Tax=Lipomyces japonicus TaxID=56871 RepID=UPI0034CE3D18